VIGSTTARALRVAVAVLTAVAASLAAAQDESAPRTYAVGLRQVEFVDTTYGPRTLTMNVFYPSRPIKSGVRLDFSPRARDMQQATGKVESDPTFEPVVLPLFRVVNVYRDADIATATEKFPLIVLSHGRGSTGLVYAWLAEYLAARGYVVAALDHYRANANDRSVVYLASKLWQRPVDVAIDITYLTTQEPWRSVIDATRIGIAGHSQGGFTALWVGGAKVNAERYLAFQRRWKNDLGIPRYLRDEMPVDATPALEVADRRVKAAFAMAPGVVQAFGMDAAGLAAMKVPAYIIVGAGDTVTPAANNATFAAQHIAQAKLVVIPGPVGHEIFVNECDEEGRNELPETCLDAPGVDRAKIHAQIGAAALQFFDASLAVPARK
jgi:predicted dienelactone hydrolase